MFDAVTTFKMHRCYAAFPTLLSELSFLYSIYYLLIFSMSLIYVSIFFPCPDRLQRAWDKNFLPDFSWKIKTI
jgi:hypothetical protein